MKMTKPTFTVYVTDWATHAAELYAVRRQVFIEEQNVPEELEQDEFDPGCWHVLAQDMRSQPIGTGRLLPDGHLGRLAVLKPWRGHGVGRALMDCLLTLARQHRFSVLELNSQVRVEAFYAEFGFIATGGIFMEAGIPHRTMRLVLPFSTYPEDRP